MSSTEGILHYYNDNDRYCAEWLRHLIAAGVLPAGDVDARPIEEVKASDLDGYTQCHFFAGIGGWAYALRLAGWDEGRQCWTASVPCQPLSSAGKRQGAADERHLWPTLHALIAQRKPTIIFGEQVASVLGREWFAAVRADMEALGYACGGADLCAASVGAPHIRQRIFWVADAYGAYSDGHAAGDNPAENRGGTLSECSARGPSKACGLADSERANEQRHGFQMAGTPREAEAEIREQRVWAKSEHGSAVSRLGNAAQEREQSRLRQREYCETGRPIVCDSDGLGHAHGGGYSRTQIYTGRQDEKAPPDQDGADWGESLFVPCADGKWRPVSPEPELFPLADGVSPSMDFDGSAKGEAEPYRIGMLRGLGNAIVPQLGAAFIQAYVDARSEI